MDEKINRKVLFSLQSLNVLLHSVGAGLLHLICRMCVHVQGERCRRMAEVFLNRFDIVAIFDRGNSVAMPLRYNNDKPEKPRNFKGLEVYQADFSSFSNPKNQATKPLFRRGC